VGTYEDAWTRSRRPVELAWCAQFPDAVQAVAFERQLKGWRRDKKEAVIAGRFDDLPALASRRRKMRDD
tara:strand:+ start:769 stop:975 length:207 start_codon:yes stop_codon:yes gene_type:complete